MWASPVVPIWSLAEPEPTAVMKLKTGAWWRSTTMNLSPLGSVNSWTCLSMASSPVRPGAGAAVCARPAFAEGAFAAYDALAATAVSATVSARASGIVLRERGAAAANRCVLLCMASPRTWD